MNVFQTFLDIIKNNNLISCYNYYNRHKINIHYGDDIAMKIAIRYNKLEVVKWIYSIDGKIKIHKNNEEYFMIACIYANIEVAKWIYSVDGTFDLNKFTYDYNPIKLICENTTPVYILPNNRTYQYKIISVLNWLNTLKIFHTNYTEIFKNLVSNSNLIIAEWLYNNFKKQIKFSNISHLLFKQSIVNNELQIGMWIYKLSNIDDSKKKFDIHKNNDEYFHLASSLNNVIFCEWLYSIDGKIMFYNKRKNKFYNEEEINMIKECNYIEIAKLINKITSENEYRIEFKIKNDEIEDVILIDKYYYYIRNESNYQEIASCKLLEKDSECLICINNINFYTEFDCKHGYCKDCSIKLNKCPMCLKIINKDNVKLLKI